MDERQQQIQVGAGLQESRLNTELIAWLEKWGTYILMGILVVVLAYVGWSRYQQYEAAQLDEAFAQYTAARGQQGADGVLNGRPDSLLKVAADFSGRKSVAMLAKLDAAEIYLGSVRRGLLPGTDLTAVKPEDAITPEKSAELVKSAEDLFTQVVSATASRGDLGVINLRARLGLAVAAASRGDAETAKRLFGEAEQAATKLGFLEFAAEAKRRGEMIVTLSAPAPLLSEADLPPLPGSTPDQLNANLNLPEGVTAEPLPAGTAPPGFTIPLPTQATPMPEGETPPAPPATSEPKKDEPAPAGEAPKTP